MGIVSWIVLGLIAGFIASDPQQDWLGADCGPRARDGRCSRRRLHLSGLLGMSGVTGVNIWSIIVSVVGAIIVLWVYEKLIANA
jgi:uncharacterized membrane protein YeaQ/YmgE (transglycosylase-associated protein family)